MSIFRYNGITLPYAEHFQFQQDAMMNDQVGGVDLMYTKFEIRLNCLINQDYLGTIDASFLNLDGTPSITNPADIMNVIRSRLLTPRKQLSVTVNGVELIPQVFDEIGTVDSRNGPVPRSCIVRQLTNSLFMVSYHIIAHYFEKPLIDADGVPVFNNALGNPVVSNRWSETVDIDLHQNSRFVREGQFTIRTDKNEALIVDQYRVQMAVVGVAANCLRESSSYAVTPDGLTLRYRVVDTQFFKPPPVPAYEARGKYFETCVNGAMHWGEVQLWLKGSAAGSQSNLAEVAIRLASAKLRIGGATINNVRLKPAILEQFSIGINLYENEVEVKMRGLMKPASSINGKGRKQGVWGIDYVGLVTTPYPGGIAAGVAPAPTYFARGSLSFLLRAAAYYDAALNNNQLAANGQLQFGTEVGAAGVQGG